MIQKIYLQQKDDFQDFKNNFPTVKKLLLFLFFIDFIFVFLHFFSLTLPITEDFTKNLRLDKDFGFSEIFQYLQFLSVSILLITLFIKEKVVVYLVWSLFYLFLCVDDAFAFHEDFGRQLVKLLNIPDAFGMRGQDFGELLMAAMLGLVFAVPFLYNLVWGSKRAQQVTVTYIILTGILVFFGVFFDMVHSFLVNLPGSGLITVIEDGGELFAGSLLLVYSYYLYKEAKQFR